MATNYPYHGAVASVHGNTKHEIDAAIDLGGFVDDNTKKRLREYVLNTGGLHVFNAIRSCTIKLKQYDFDVVSICMLWREARWCSLL